MKCSDCGARATTAKARRAHGCPSGSWEPVEVRPVDTDRILAKVQERVDRMTADGYSVRFAISFGLTQAEADALGLVGPGFHSELGALLNR